MSFCVSSHQNRTKVECKDIYKIYALYCVNNQNRTRVECKYEEDYNELEDDYESEDNIEESEETLEEEEQEEVDDMAIDAYEEDDDEQKSINNIVSFLFTYSMIYICIKKYKVGGVNRCLVVLYKYSTKLEFKCEII